MLNQKDTIAAREDFIRSCLARCRFHSEIITECHEHPLFLLSKLEQPAKKGTKGKGKKPARRVPKPMARSTIRGYVDRVLRELRETVFEGEQEVIKTYESLIHAFRVAEVKGNVRGMIAAQSRIMYLLKLGQANLSVASEIPESIVAELERTVLPGKFQESQADEDG